MALAARGGIGAVHSRRIFGQASALCPNCSPCTELDINQFWGAGYLYTHHPGGLVAVPVLPARHGSSVLAPNSRDFLAVVAN